MVPLIREPTLQVPLCPAVVEKHQAVMKSPDDPGLVFNAAVQNEQLVHWVLLDLSSQGAPCILPVRGASWTQGKNLKLPLVGKVSKQR